MAFGYTRTRSYMFERILLIKRKQWPRYMIVWMTQLSLSLALKRPSVLFFIRRRRQLFRNERATAKRPTRLHK